MKQKPKNVGSLFEGEGNVTTLLNCIFIFAGKLQVQVQNCFCSAVLL